MSTFLIAIGIVLIIEGLGPLCVPKAWRGMLAQLSEQDDNQLRRLGGSFVVAGIVIIIMLTQ